MQHWRCKLLLFGTRQIWMPSPGAEKGAGILVLQVFLVAKVFNSLLALSLICTMPTILMRNTKTVFTRPAGWLFPQTADEF